MPISMQFEDFLILYVLQDRKRKELPLLPQSDFIGDGGLLDTYAKQLEIPSPAVYQRPSERRLNVGFAHMKAVGYVKGDPLCTISERGKALLGRYGNDWRKWPVELPFSSTGRPMFDHAQFIPPILH